VTLLGLLNPSATFDTVDHDMLLRRLVTSFGISGLTLKWISSFLTGRTQAVVFRGMTSAYSTVKYGVLQVQGNVLGQLQFLLYTADVTAVAGRHDVSVRSYADDTQLYTSCFAVDGLASAVQLLRCIDDISQWMASNRLKLMLIKQFTWLGSPRLAAVSQVQLIVGEVVTASDTVWDLDVTLDAQLTMKNHIDGVAHSCFYQL